MFQRCTGRLQQLLGKGGVEQHDGKGCSRRTQPVQSIGLLNPRRGRVQAGQIVAQHARRQRLVFNEHHFAGAARQGLDAKCAAAGEQVQAACARQHRCQPVEQGFPHPVRRGAQSGQLGKGQSPAAPLAADDAQQVGGPGAWLHEPAGAVAGAAGGVAVAGVAVPPTMTVSRRSGWTWPCQAARTCSGLMAFMRAM